MKWTSKFIIKDKKIFHVRMNEEDCCLEDVLSTVAEIDQRFCEAFPKLYKDRRKSCTVTCMSWGFECGPGWYHLLWELSEKIEKLIEDEGDMSACASQVKEKYGGLRFYMNFVTDEMDDLIDVAEDLSEKTCELCGAPGKLMSDGWVSCRCKNCRSIK